MPTTNFVSGVTVLPADWCNDLDAFYYETFGATGGLACIGDTANAKMTIGLTINQLANDNEILALKSSDVAHGVTDFTETDTFAAFSKYDAATGGVMIQGLSEDKVGMVLAGTSVNDDTVKSTSSTGCLRIIGYKKSGTTQSSVGADGNLMVVVNSGTTRFVLDGDGDSHQDVGTAWTNFHEHDDVALLKATSALLDDALKKQFTKGFLTKNKKKLSQLGIVTFNKDGHHFINWSRFQMLHMGATQWLADRLAVLETKLLNGT